MQNRSRVLRSFESHSLSRYFLPSMETKVSLLCTQESATGPVLPESVALGLLVSLEYFRVL